MSYCKPVGEVDYLKTDWIPNKLKYMYADYTLPEFVLCVRNGTVNEFMYDDSIPDAEKLELSDMVSEVLEVLMVNGFIRLEMMTISNPELYFTMKYIVSLELIKSFVLAHETESGCKDLDEVDYEEALMPYFFSNEDYEKYVFSYERVEATINLLSNYLDEEELYEVALDVMSVGNSNSDEEIIKRACDKMKENSLDLIPKLVQAFEHY
jgi:hypothetical protein